MEWCFVAIIIMGTLAKLFIISSSKRLLQDAYTYHLMARNMNAHNTSCISADFYLIDRYYKVNLDYPFFFPYLFSLINVELREKYFRQLNVLLEFLNVCSTIIMAYLLSNNINVAIVTGTLFYLTPILFRESFEFTGRIFANLIYNIMIVSFICFCNNGSIDTLIIAYIFGLILIISHKMELQGLLFLSIGFSILEMSLIPIISYCSLLILGIIFFKNRYIEILRGHIRFLVWVRRYCSSNNIKYNLYGFIGRLLKFILCNPLILVIIYFYNDSKIIDNISFDFYIATMILFGVAYLIVEIKKLNFIGTGERYLEQVAFFSAYLVAVLLKDNENFLNILVLALIIGNLYITFRVENNGDSVSKTALNEVIKFLITRNEKNCIVYPNNCCNIIGYYGNKIVMGGLSSKALAKADDYFFNKISMIKIFERYNIELIVAKKNYDLRIMKDLVLENIIFENNEFIIYKLGG